MERIDPRITAAQEQAEQTCAAALASTPDPYKPFLIMLPQRKKVGEGTGGKGIYADIAAPYMAINGRIKMARDDHRAQEKRLDIAITFCQEPLTGHLLCKAVLHSDIHGTVEAHARVFLDGRGVDKTNPLENAESSAIGRALGFMGYGLLGTGIASAEEVMQARETDERPGTPTRPMPMMTGPRTGAQDETDERPASERQLSYLRTLLERTGTAEKDLAVEMAAATRSAAWTTRRIGALQQEIRQSTSNGGDE